MILLSKKLAIFIATAFMLAAPLAHASGPWKILDKGLEYSMIEPDLARPTKDSQVRPQIHVFRIDPDFYKLRPLYIKSGERISIRQLVEAKGAVVGINASFFDTKISPLGVLIQDGKILNPFKNISWWGVFFQESGKKDFHIVHSSRWNQTKKYDLAIQTGPRLVINHKTAILKPEISPKSAVGITATGKIIILATLYPVKISDIANLMARPEKNGGLGCVDALNLDGGSSTQVYAKTDDFELKLPSYVGVPVGLGVFKKN